MDKIDIITEEMEKQGLSGYRLAKLSGMFATDLYAVLKRRKYLWPAWEKRIFAALGIDGDDTEEGDTLGE